MKEVFIVSIGSFFGGGMRYLVSKLVTVYAPVAFPLGTMVVNVAGCLLIGFLSGLSWTGSVMSPTMRLLLTTGFCGGFTTFSTFMSESAALTKDGAYLSVLVYLAGSVVLGFLAVLVGQQMAKALG